MDGFRVISEVYNLQLILNINRKVTTMIRWLIRQLKKIPTGSHGKVVMKVKREKIVISSNFDGSHNSVIIQHNSGHLWY